jgi:hypothetical protein
MRFIAGAVKGITLQLGEGAGNTFLAAFMPGGTADAGNTE